MQQATLTYIPTRPHKQVEKCPEIFYVNIPNAHDSKYILRVLGRVQGLGSISRLRRQPIGSRPEAAEAQYLLVLSAEHGKR